MNDVQFPPATVNISGMTWDGERGAFAKAFVAAQKATDAVKKASTNPAFRSKYADLAGVVEAVVPALNNAGIGVIQSPAFNGEMVELTTILIHETGSSVSSVLAIRPSKLDAQGIGSAVTYARRYALLAMTGAAPEDDDGAAASGPRQEAPPRDTVGRPRLSSAEAKRQGLHDAFSSELEEITDLDVLDVWVRQRLPQHKTRVPIAWLESMDDKVEIHRNGLVDKMREDGLVREPEAA